MNRGSQSDAALVAVERVPVRVLAPLSAAAVGVPAALAVALDGWIAVALAAVAVAAIGGAGAVWRLRARLRGLPLELGPVAARATLDGKPAFWFRARLGMGRLARGAVAEVSWRGDDGTVVALEAIAPAGPRVGPWTVVAVDHARRIGPGGTFVVRVTADDGRAWAAERAYTPADVRPGRFGAVWGEVVPPVE